MKKMICGLALCASLGLSSVGFAGTKITIPDQPQEPVVVSGKWRAKVFDWKFRDDNERAVIKFKIGYQDSGFNKYEKRKANLVYENIDDDPETPEDETSTAFDDCLAAFADTQHTGSDAFEVFLSANLPANWPENFIYE